MKLCLLCPENSADLNEILLKALGRSFTRAQVESVSIVKAEKPYKPRVWVIAGAPDEWADFIIEQLAISGSKIMLLGRIPKRLAEYLGVTVSALPADFASHVSCSPAAAHHSSHSKAVVRYRDTKRLLGIDCPIEVRPCLRYDFADEWNNLVYGAICADGSLWSLAQQVHWPEEQLLGAVESEGQILSSYAALCSSGNASLLWFNRSVGPVDSQEWRLVEQYFSSYDYPASACLPVISEIPEGFDAVVTMRLDCDEDIASAEALFALYQSEHIPFSLAVTTQLLKDSRHQPLLRAVIASGGSLLSHSATHPVNWGGSYEAALAEVTASRSALKSALVDDTRVDYAVSPFHQNPSYAVAAMVEGGLLGFVGGIVRNDPEYLIARAGEVPFGPEGFISHSQQCMLHGDSILSSGDPLAVFKESFDIALKGRALFGYLDHPFSQRYQYGWGSEAVRIEAHKAFIAYIRSRGKILFLSQNDALDWLRYKSSVELSEKAGHFYVTSVLSSPWKVRIEFAGVDSVPHRIKR